MGISFSEFSETTSDVLSGQSEWLKECTTSSHSQKTMLQIYQSNIENPYHMKNDIVRDIMQLSTSELKKYCLRVLQIYQLPVPDGLLESRSRICRKTLDLLLGSMNLESVVSPIKDMFELLPIQEKTLVTDSKLVPQSVSVWDDGRNQEVLVSVADKTIQVLRTDLSNFDVSWSIEDWTPLTLIVTFDSQLVISGFNEVRKYTLFGEQIWRTELWNREADDFYDVSGLVTSLIETSDHRIATILERHVFILNGETGEILQKTRLDVTSENLFALPNGEFGFQGHKIRKWSDDGNHPILIDFDGAITQIITNSHHDLILIKTSWSVYLYRLDGTLYWKFGLVYEGTCGFSNSGQYLAIATDYTIVVYSVSQKQILLRLFWREQFGTSDKDLLVSPQSVLFSSDDTKIYASCKIKNSVHVMKWDLFPFENRQDRALISSLDISLDQSEAMYDLMQRVKANRG